MLARLNVVSLFAAWLLLSIVHAAEDPAAPRYSDELVEYPAAYFGRYRPETALEMVQRLPGFRIDEGAGQRGYGESAGNILINGRRPASKTDSPADILDRIPARQVRQLELIRGPVGDIELLGQTEVVNVVILEDTPAAVSWSATGVRNSQMKTLPWNATAALSDIWRGLDYTVGFDLNRRVRSDLAEVTITDGVGDLLEEWHEEGVETGYEGSATAIATTWLGAYQLDLNLLVEMRHGTEPLDSVRRDANGDLHTERFAEDYDSIGYETGLALERRYNDELRGRLILLYNREDEQLDEFQRSLDAAGIQFGLKEKETDALESETIARLETEWSGWRNHVIRFDAESAWNLLDNAEAEREDDGSGPQDIIIPGANTRVRESRQEFSLRDTWTPGGVEIDYGFAVEFSTITQTGDSNLSRDFVYLKPQLLLSRDFGSSLHARLRLAREVGQLDFDDFVSASEFGDEELLPGNPELRPDRTWVSELVLERRLASGLVASVTFFHHRIDDVLDLLPLTATEEAPGNIGSGQRTGMLMEMSMPLDRLGLTGGRLDLHGRWQDSSVTDPVTGIKRELSITDQDDEDAIKGNSEYVLQAALRQDIEALRASWGGEVEVGADMPRFKVDELDLRDNATEVNLFVETSRWVGIRARLELNNILNMNQYRTRHFYSGARGLSALESRQHKRGTDGRELVLSLSGTF